MRRIYIVFERWLQFAELRGGYRSLDYPFGYIELNIDPATGNGEGTYIAAARIRWRTTEAEPYNSPGMVAMMVFSVLASVPTLPACWARR